MWIAETKVNHQASVFWQQPMTTPEEAFRFRVMQIKNWTAPGLDTICVYCLRKLTLLQKKAGMADEEVCCNETSEYREQLKWVLRWKPFSKNKMTTIDTFTVPAIQYSYSAGECNARKKQK